MWGDHEGWAKSYIQCNVMQTPSILKWYLARLTIEAGHQEDMCYDEIGLCA